MNSQHAAKPPRQRAKRRELYCHLHHNQRLLGNGQKYFLHLLTPEQLKQRGFSDKKARLLINAYPVYVLSNEWLEQLFCGICGCQRWYHLHKDPDRQLTSQLATRDLWQQVAHVEPMRNPTISQFSQREARRHGRRRDGRRFYDAS